MKANMPQYSKHLIFYLIKLHLSILSTYIYKDYSCVGTIRTLSDGATIA